MDPIAIGWEIWKSAQTGIQFQNSKLNFQNSHMSLSEDQIKRIQDKLQLLVKQHGVLQKENLSLKEEINNTKKLAEQQHENMDRLKQQVEVLKLSSGEMNEAEKKQFEKRINAYIKEIDRCIAMLSS